MNWTTNSLMKKKKKKMKKQTVFLAEELPVILLVNFGHDPGFEHIEEAAENHSATQQCNKLRTRTLLLVIIERKSNFEIS